MKRTIFIILLTIVFVFGCTKKTLSESAKTIFAINAEEQTVSFKRVSMKEGIALSRNNPDSIIVDVRRPEEYGSGHIPGAVILTMEKINEETAQAVLPDKNQMILIYCRSGNRSKIAAQMLVELGYQNVYEIGGIFDYSGEIEK
jgi:rhodanese-related sulfurtransferase